MSDIQRYALQTELSEDSLGKWVRYEDHLDEVAWAVSEVLDAAREAVAAAYDDERYAHSDDWGVPVVYKDLMLAAIDALRRVQDE